MLIRRTDVASGVPQLVGTNPDGRVEQRFVNHSTSPAFPSLRAHFEARRDPAVRRAFVTNLSRVFQPLALAAEIVIRRSRLADREVAGRIFFALLVVVPELR